MTEHELPKTRSGEPRAFFGRRSGKKLHDGQQAIVDTTLPEVEIKLEGKLDPKSVFPGAQRIVVEIGYGGGEHLARKAAEEPDTGFIGCEVYTGGIGKMVQAIDARGLTNVRLFTDDALKLLMALPDASLDAVYLLYPDPWPKTRHHKRRFVSPTTLAELARVIRPGGTFYFATDIEDYADWTLAHIVRAPEFAFEPEAPGSWHQPYPGWQPTRYEQKARREGRMISFYFGFRRR
ncbi:tRNA (guanosine(46)-N7)-methyltransferase TrmB [Devosia sp. SD17-2]|jgi:tRNA (guanine-N7-)-methyltransferase|uniref:tRNA (guanosine(46)-N7)-methyltransferase TrmB n=1 Tax=Devosia sp. SD17-2 TaxID=2976459 RepID=UPI0023D84048|nr:tRNA (guanosine(46)-N7)-methyltransferase TrmB [Devosia sp. SD17-2]WEJ33306.1 tRNA (guanosine(46)-N7)-methyltransferase TrmB [Devosia sp. SD17-2]